MPEEMGWEQDTRYNIIRKREDAWAPYPLMRRWRAYGIAITIYAVLVTFIAGMLLVAHP